MEFGQRLDQMILEVFPNLNDAVIPLSQKLDGSAQLPQLLCCSAVAGGTARPASQGYFSFFPTFLCALSFVPPVQPIPGADGCRKEAEAAGISAEPLGVLQVREELCTRSLCQSRG